MLTSSAPLLADWAQTARGPRQGFEKSSFGAGLQGGWVPAFALQG